MSPPHQTARELSARLSKKEISSVELTRACLDRIDAIDPKVGAFLSVFHDEALAMARAADERRAAGETDALLLGLPIAIKDNMCARGLPTTCASRLLENFRPPYDATVVARLRRAGAVFLGKTNMDEFAMGSSNEHSAFKPCRNPWDLERIPGGSSGGSAAAVAAGMAPWALGSDTGGSIRQPASFCGVVGLKPTYGRVSRYGLVAFGSSLDQIGPLTIDVADAAFLLGAIAGHDPMDSTSHDRATPDYLDGLDDGVDGMTVGIPKEYFIEGLDAEVESAVRAAVARLEALGARVREVSLPHSRYCVAAYYLCAPAEASSNLARYDGVHYGARAAGCDNIIEMYTKTRRLFGDEVKRRIMIGTFALSAGFYDAYYLKALKTRTLIQRDFIEAFEDVDVIATPVSPSPPFKVGAKTDDPLEMYLQDIFTLSLNLTGFPGLSVPCGMSKDNLPIGLQLIAPPFEEQRILKAARAAEDSSDLARRRPSIADAE